MKKALVVFSGGQDSSTCLYYAVKHYDAVYTIGFKYGQRHEIELECRKDFIESFPRALNVLGTNNNVTCLPFGTATWLMNHDF